MGYTEKRSDNEIVIYKVHTVLGTPTGASRCMPCPVRGRVMECGFSPDSLVASAITLAVSIDDHNDSAASNFTQIITSTLGTFSSTNLYEGAVASVAPPSPSFIAQGGSLRYTTSGGNTSAIGGTLYAVIRKA